MTEKKKTKMKCPWCGSDNTDQGSDLVADKPDAKEWYVCWNCLMHFKVRVNQASQADGVVR